MSDTDILVPRLQFALLGIKQYELQDISTKHLESQQLKHIVLLHFAAGLSFTPRATTTKAPSQTSI